MLRLLTLAVSLLCCLASAEPDYRRPIDTTKTLLLIAHPDVRLTSSGSDQRSC